MRKSQQKSKKRAVTTIKRLQLNNMTFPTIVRCAQLDQFTATTAAALSFFLNYPSYYRNTGGTIAQMTQTASLLANEQKVFDEYKVQALKLYYLPFEANSVYLNSYTTATGNTGVSQVAPNWDPSVIVGLDLDDSANYTTLPKALNSQGFGGMYLRTGNAVKSLITMKQVDPLEKLKWLNLGAIIPNVTTPPDPNNPAKMASIKVYTGGYPIINSAVGWFVAEWEVIMRGAYTLS